MTWPGASISASRLCHAIILIRCKRMSPASACARSAISKQPTISMLFWHFLWRQTRAVNRGKSAQWYLQIPIRFHRINSLSRPRAKVKSERTIPYGCRCKENRTQNDTVRLVCFDRGKLGRQGCRLDGKLGNPDRVSTAAGGGGSEGGLGRARDHQSNPRRSH